MEEASINKEKTISYWINSSEDDYTTMNILYDSKRYSWSLFIGHLMIEKLLKAYYIKKKEEHPPFIHNLLRLAEKTELLINDERKTHLITITAFNINGRYDDYKNSFKQLCTPSYTKEWISNIKDIRQWIKKQLK